ncbi:Protein of unknown function, partial [Gryllus bimaculatus]
MLLSKYVAPLADVHEDVHVVVHIDDVEDGDDVRVAHAPDDAELARQELGHEVLSSRHGANNAA